MFISELLGEEMEALKDELSELGSSRDLDRVCELLESVSLRTVRVGVGALLVDADVGRFERQLSYSGYARRWYLQRLDGRVGDSRHRAPSRWPSLWASLAVGRIDLARELAARESPTFVRDGEYEDDFMVVHAVHALLLGRDPALATARIAEGAPEVAALLDTIHGRDGAALAPALAAFVAAETDAVLAVPDAPEALDDELARRISLPVLGLTQLARQLGLVCELPDHERCPPLTQALPGPHADDIITELRP